MNSNNTSLIILKGKYKRMKRRNSLYESFSSQPTIYTFTMIIIIIKYKLNLNTIYIDKIRILTAHFMNPEP